MPSVTADAGPVISPRRRELLEAAVRVVADDGLRGLTHRAVDRQAGLPEGTCSAYLRTRQALQVAVTGYVAVALTADVDRLGSELAECAGDEDRAATLTLALFERWLDDRELVVARLELSLEAPRNPAVAEVLADARRRLVAVVEGILSRADKHHSRQRAETLVASFDGLLLEAMQKPAPERRRFLTDSLAMLLHALAAPRG